MWEPGYPTEESGQAYPTEETGYPTEESPQRPQKQNQCTAIESGYPTEEIGLPTEEGRGRGVRSPSWPLKFLRPSTSSEHGQLRDPESNPYNCLVEDVLFFPLQLRVSDAWPDIKLGC